jgi:outer membrane protein assembly factor BamD
MRLRRLLGLFATGLLVASCGPHTSPLQNMTADQLFARGTDALHRRKWNDAVQAFEQFTLQFPTSPRAQEARFRLGEAYMGKKEYITAATELAKLATDYPAGNYADDARLRICESYYRLSPKSQLDQQYTKAAVDHCQALEAYYPNSEFVAESRRMAKEMLDKLAEKDYRAGEYYFKRSAYDSAILYFESTLTDYPTTASAPRSLLRLYQAYTNLGYKEEADAARARLLKDYPESDAAKSIKGTATASAATPAPKDTISRP